MLNPASADRCGLAIVNGDGPMDRKMAEQHIVETEAVVAEGEQHIVDQELRIAELRRDGHRTASAIELLAIFKNCQALHIEHRDWLRRELGLV